jgi:aryl-alcohol dehydrogenase-like predicted oxidoreductase
MNFRGESDALLHTTIHALLPQLPFLGFGTGKLLNNRRTPRKALYLLETARDCGVTWFDTARMYGAGQVEEVLGQMITKGRDKIILVTKAGILPQSRAFHMRAMGLAARLTRKVLPALQPYVRVPKAAQLKNRAFGEAEFRLSVETSLRTLKTDYIDILLLHECFPDDVESPGVLDFLLELKREGKIRAFGLGTGIEQTCAILARHPELSEVVQIPSPVFDRNIARLPAGVGLPVIHSVLSLTSLSAAGDHPRVKQWIADTGVDPEDKSAMVQLMLAYGLSTNPRGIVLFESSKPAHIRANLRAVKERRFEPRQLQALERLVNGESLIADRASRPSRDP